jgi:hypothetical protein
MMAKWPRQSSQPNGRSIRNRSRKRGKDIPGERAYSSNVGGGELLNTKKETSKSGSKEDISERRTISAVANYIKIRDISEAATNRHSFLCKMVFSRECRWVSLMN